MAQEGYEISHNLKGPYVRWEGITRNDECNFYSLSWLTNQVGSGAGRWCLTSDKACVSLALGSSSPARPELMQSKRECTALGQRRVTTSAGSVIFFFLTTFRASLTWRMAWVLLGTLALADCPDLQRVPGPPLSMQAGPVLLCLPCLIPPSLLGNITFKSPVLTQF